MKLIERYVCESVCVRASEWISLRTFCTFTISLDPIKSPGAEREPADRARRLHSWFLWSHIFRDVCAFFSCTSGVESEDKQCGRRVLLFEEMRKGARGRLRPKWLWLVDRWVTVLLKVKSGKQRPLWAVCWSAPHSVFPGLSFGNTLLANILKWHSAQCKV